MLMKKHAKFRLQVPPRARPAPVLQTAIFLAMLATAWRPAAAAGAPPVLPPPDPPEVTSLPLDDEPPGIKAGPDGTYLDFLRHVEDAAPEEAATATAELIDQVGGFSEATTLPAWLVGPATGTVMGVALPLPLDGCVHLALQHNFGLQQSELDLMISDSSYSAAQFEFVPFVTLFSGYTYTNSKTGVRQPGSIEGTRTHAFDVGVNATQKSPTGASLSIEHSLVRTRVNDRGSFAVQNPATGETEFVHDSVASHSYDNSLRVTGRQPLLRGGGFRVGMASLRRARLSNIGAYLSDQIRRRDAALNVIRAYFLILRNQLDAEISVDALSERRDFHKRTMELARLGEIAPSETSRTQILMLNEEQNLRQSERGFLDSLDRLLQLMGAPLETPIRLRPFVGRVTQLEELGLADTETCVREALANRPEMIQADLGVRQARIALDQAKNGVLPILDVSASYTDDETGPHVSSVNSLDDSRRWSLGALFQLPFPDKDNKENLVQARLRLKKAEIARENQERSINEEVRGLARGLSINADRIEILEKSVEIAERNLTVQRFLLDEGESTFLDVRNSQDEFFQARRDYNNAMLAYQADLAGLYVAIGWPLFEEAPRAAMTSGFPKDGDLSSL